MEGKRILKGILGIKLGVSSAQFSRNSEKAVNTGKSSNWFSKRECHTIALPHVCSSVMKSRNYLITKFSFTYTFILSFFFVLYWNMEYIQLEIVSSL